MLFAETTTLGVRAYESSDGHSARYRGNAVWAIDVKVAQLNGHIIKEMPEYEQCRLAARAADVVADCGRCAGAFVKLNR